MERRDHLFIGGEWVAPNASGTLDIISPVSEERIATVPEPGAEGIDGCVELQSIIFSPGGRTSPH